MAHLISSDIPAFLGDSIDGLGILIDERENANLFQRLEVEVLPCRIVRGGGVLVGPVVIVCAHPVSTSQVVVFVKS